MNPINRRNFFAITGSIAGVCAGLGDVALAAPKVTVPGPLNMQGLMAMLNELKLAYNRHLISCNSVTNEEMTEVRYGYKITY